MVGVDFDSVTSALATKCITHAENEINKQISKRYNVSSFQTSTAVPPLLTSLCETLAEGYIYKRSARGGPDMMKQGQDLIDQAMENLALIRDYKVDLLNTAGSVIVDFSNTAYRVMSNTDTYTPTFAEDDETNWSVDSDKLDDIADARD